MDDNREIKTNMPLSAQPWKRECETARPRDSKKAAGRCNWWGCGTDQLFVAENEVTTRWAINELLAHTLPCTLFASLLLSCAQVTDDYTVIGRSLFKKETNLQLFVGLKVTLSTGETGVIEGGFGQSGKFKIRIQGKDLVKQLPWCFLLHITVSPPSPVLTSGANSLSFLEFWGSPDSFQDVVKVVGVTSRATFPGFLWGLHVFRGKPDQCLFYLLLLKTHNSTPGGKRKQKYLEREPHLHPFCCLTPA